MTRRRRTIILAIVAAAAVLIAGRAVSALYVDYRWYAELHAAAVWRASLVNHLLLTGWTAVVTTLFLFANLYAVRRSISSVVLPRRVGNVEIGEELPGQYLTVLAAVVAVGLGVLLAMPPEAWTQLAAARYGVPFGESEPYFQMDLGFYAYWLPLENALYVRTLLVLVGTFLIVTVLYVVVTPSLRWDRTHFRITAHVRRHAAALTPCFFAVLAWNYRLSAYAVLSHGAGVGGMFTYSDHHFVVPADRILALLLLAAGVVAGIALWRNQLRTTFVVLTASLLILALYHFSLPLVEHAVSGSEAIRRNQDYEVIRAQATRAAFAVDRLTPMPATDAPGSFTSLRQSAPRVSIWDPSALTQALARSRRSGAIASTVAWRPSPSGLLALAIEHADGSAPVSGPESVPGSAALLPVRATAVDERGAPVRTDLAGRASTDEVPVPPVLFYTGARGSVMVSDSLDRIPAPHIDGFLARLAEAWSAQHLGLLTSDLPEPRPKLVARRDVLERIEALAPFFVPGTTVWPIVASDSLYWAVDLYSTAEYYPLSQHFFLARQFRSYFQHAATALVHAYTGRVLLVADSVRDPIAETWVRRFPGLFITWAEVPAALGASMPPAVDAARAVASAFAASGARLAGTAGAGEPERPVPEYADSLLGGGQPPCVMMIGDDGCTWALPLEDVAERVTGLVTAIGGLHRALLWTALDTTAPRWSAAAERLQRSTDSLTTGHREASVARGQVRALLIANHLALVQPAYAWISGEAPSILAVTTILGDTARAAATLAEAVGADSALSSTVGIGDLAGSTLAFRQRVGALYDSMEAALRRGDLAAFGSAYGELGRLLGRPTENRPGAGARAVH